MKNVDKSSIDGADIVIVGNGIAGLTAAVEARRLAPDLRIAIITTQNHPTINTPALKQFAIGKLTRDQLLAYPPGTERAQRIHVIQARVEEINAQGKYITLTGGRGFGYGSLLIATGSTPTGLPANLPGRDFDGVLILHRLPDYLNLVRRLSEVEEAVVIGGGPHAIETVMSLLHWDIQVHWLIRSATFLPKMLDQPASEMVLEHARQVGAKVYLETEVVGIMGRIGVVAGVVTNHQKMLPCQLVLTCTGTTPSMKLAERCNIPMKYKRGILVDDQLRTSVPGIYAAGDVAALRNPQTGTFEPRAQWYAAVLQGRAVAATITGNHKPEEDSFGVRWHATQLGELLMLTVGNLLNWTESTENLTDTTKGSYRRLTIIDDRLVGYLSLGRTQPDSLALKRIIDEGLSIRDIKKELLKGEFDARAYFSQQRSHTARGMVRSGKLPALDPVPQEKGTSGRLPALVEVQSTVPNVVPLVRLLPETGPLPTAKLASALPEERVGTSNLSIPSKEVIETEDLAHHPKEDNQSGLLPRLLPARKSRSTSGSFWSYSGKVPVVKQGQFQQPSRSLWSYSNKNGQRPVEGKP